MKEFFDSPLSRRKLFARLSIAGAGLYLPFFKTLEAHAQGGAAPKRVVIIALAHGWQRIYNSRFNEAPASFAGAEKSQSGLNYSDNFALRRSFSPFNAIKDKVTFLDGVRMGLAWPNNAHDVAYTHMLTAAVPYGEGGSADFPRPQHESIDNYLGRKMGTNVLRMSANYQSWGKPFHPLSWDQNLNQLGFYTDPKSAFNGVIGQLRLANNGATASVTNDPVAAKGSHVFDALKGDIKSIERELVGESKEQFQRYLELMDGVYKKVSNTSGIVGVEGLPLPTEPQNGDPAQNLDKFYEIAVATVATASHPVVVLGVGETNTARFGKEFHHYVAHYDNPAGSGINSVLGWAEWNAEKVVQFAKRLDSIRDTDGRTVLDNTMIVLVGEVGDGTHDQRHMGIPIIGGAWGKLSGNRFYKMPTFLPQNKGVFMGGQDRSGNVIETNVGWVRGSAPTGLHTIGDVWATVADLAGYPVARFGHACHNVGKIRVG